MKNTKINLYINYFRHNNEQRQKEIDYCLQKNINNKYIDKIYILSKENYEIFHNDKIKIIPIEKRPSYNYFFKTINKISQNDNINIIANLDIYFDETIIYAKNIKNNQCFALTRWEIKKDKIKFLNKGCSQDSWIFKGKIKNIKSGFYLGRMGCDNKIAYEIQQAKYKITNPSRTIKTYHLHQIKHTRNYENKKVLPPPYLNVPTTRIKANR